jgi:sulfhydrogenase subunit beta (sulfur reductase)
MNMAVEKKLLKKESLEKLFNFLKGLGNKIYAPVRKENRVMFRPVNTLSETTWDYIQTVQSAKNVVFPKIETLFSYTTTRSSVTIKDVDETKYPDTVLWGIHPCDAAAIHELDAVFTGEYTDIQFKSRLNKLTVIGLSCAKADNYCFCTSVSLKPNDMKGSDILLTPLISGDYLAEMITEKGRNIMNQSAALFAEFSNHVDSLVTDVPVRFDTRKVASFLSKNFDHPFWAENSLRCIGCGTCAFVCPACTCYDIQDESAGMEGRRVRCWDSCCLGLFTQHASGHNPREVQSQRWRQRVMHKFSYIPETRNALGCIGCGRCSRACPADMNITEQLVELSAMNENAHLVLH